MGAGRRMRVQLTLLVATRSNLLQAGTEQPSFSGLEAFDRSDLARREVLRKALEHGHVLAQELADVFGDHAGGIVGFGPWAIAINNEVGDQQRGNDAIGNALSGIASDDVAVLVAPVAAHETEIIGRLHDLAGPAMGDAAHLGETLARPTFERSEPPFPVIGGAGFVILTADDHHVLAL